MITPTLSADCSRCAALCCLALAFDRSPMFAMDKAAGEGCSLLDACGRCSIYPARARRGFEGCVEYECLGAGQRVTQELFGGRSWLTEPDLIGPMTEAFMTIARGHRLLELLREAEALPLSSAENEQRTHLSAAITTARADAAAIADLEGETRTFLRSLKGRAVSTIGSELRRRGVS